MNLRRLLVLPLLMAGLALPLLAQKHEFSLTGGGNFASNDAVDMDPGFSVQLSYDHRLLNARIAALYLDVPLAFGLGTDSFVPSLSGIERRELSSVFFAPGLKLKLAPNFPVSPFFTLGGGLAHFNLSGSPSSPERSANKLAAEFGGGIDAKVAPFLSLRGELRDYRTGDPFPDLAGTPSSGGQHNLLPMAGIVLRF